MINAANGFIKLKKVFSPGVVLKLRGELIKLLKQEFNDPALVDYIIYAPSGPFNDFSIFPKPHSDEFGC